MSDQDKGVLFASEIGFISHNFMPPKRLFALSSDLNSAKTDEI